jgi:hypothetical protein
MYCFEHELWNQLFTKENQIVLKTIYRQNDETLLKVLKYVRKGQITPSTKATLASRIFKHEDLDLIKKEKVLTILSPIKRDVEHINAKEYLKLITTEMNKKDYKRWGKPASIEQKEKLEILDYIKINEKGDNSSLYHSISNLKKVLEYIQKHSELKRIENYQILVYL